MAITVSLLLSITSTQLNSLQQKNIEIDMKKNILKSIGVDISVMSADKIIDLYSTIIDEVVNPGNYSILWNANDYEGTQIPTGIYLVILEANEVLLSHKLLLMK